MGAYLLRLSLVVVAVALIGAARTGAQPLQDLRASLESAKQQAQKAEGLDAAYELVGIAEAADRQKRSEIATEAIGVFVGVTERATQAALQAPIADAQNTLDQLVDLSFFARTSNVAAADGVLQKSLRALFPKLMADLRRALATAGPGPEQWPEAVSNLSILGELQAATALTMLDDLTPGIGQAFDDEAKRLNAIAAQAAGAERETYLSDLDAARKTRDEQLADAKTNNLSSVAANLNKSGRGEMDQQASSDADADINASCTETGAVDPDGGMGNMQDVATRLEEECVLSGRAPTESRCTMTNISYLCRQPGNDGMEELIYIYRGSPDEKSYRNGCKGDILGPAQAAGRTPPFSNAAMRRLISCAPVASDAGASSRE